MGPPRGPSCMLSKVVYVEAHKMECRYVDKKAKFEEPNLKQVGHEFLKSWRIVRLNQWAKNIISKKTGVQTSRML